MLPALNTLIRMALFACAVIGSVMLFQEVWASVYQHLRRSYYGVNHRRLLRVNRGFGSLDSSSEEQPFLFVVRRHLEDVLQATLRGSRLQDASNFVLFSFIVAATTFVLFYLLIHRLDLVIIPSLLALFSPYFFLLVRRYHISINNSYAIVEAMNILIPAYRKEHKSMLHALTQTAHQLPSGSIRRAFGRLVDRLSEYASPSEAREALRRFVAQLGTTWAIQISNDIEHALLDGVDVEQSLVMMYEEMQEIQDALKEQNLDRADSLMVAVVPFIFWPILMQYFYLRLTHHIYQYQFDNPVGFKWFLITMVCTVGSLLVGIIFYKPKQDV